ncbi:hypothetical protein [Siminovitchia terrae]|uniref:hypothetical protein n=1 Tax=Siminovitchia terrae TaxID=1914933 RepID=UPI001B03261C|nr:hypothetical protein [Siminovitchia terrae]GIN89854.1 hypothetical protein J22TS1_09050 [Siminovitchia terrae]
MNIENFQTNVELDVANWDNTNIAETIDEIVHFSRNYENEVVTVHQIVNIGNVTKAGHRFLIILNHTRDLDNLGEELDF